MDANPEHILRNAGGISETPRHLASGKSGDEKKKAKKSPKPNPDLGDFLAIENWTQLDIPAPDRLLGDFITTTTRSFLVGSTGTGKTLFGLAMACGIAGGTGFLHWRSHRPARVLYIDGEMPGELIKQRSVDALRRLGRETLKGNLLIFARDSEEELRKRFRELSPFEPLNTQAGQDFVLELIGMLGKIDVVIFDNVMSLISGDQKDEVPWSETLPLVAELTRMQIGQVWIDHTGHNTDRQYGSSTKAWRFDAVAIMASLSREEKAAGELAFTLSFDHPGKARRRTPENWDDFSPQTIHLVDDVWSCDAISKTSRMTAKLSPVAKAFYDALQDALAIAPIPGRTNREAWYAECVRTGIADPIEKDDSAAIRGKKGNKLRKYIAEFKTAGLIGVDGESITFLRKP